MRFVLSVIILIGLTGTLFAMHEANHRYTVLGYVRNEQGDVKPGLVVTVEHKGGEKQQTKTNGSGYYEVLFHLHNGNLGDEMIVTAGTAVKRVVMAFDPEDKFTDRSSRVDFGAKEKEKPFVYWLGAGGGGLLLCAAMYFALVKKKKQVPKKGKSKKGHGPHEGNVPRE